MKNKGYRRKMYHIKSLKQKLKLPVKTLLVLSYAWLTYAEYSVVTQALGYHLE